MAKKNYAAKIKHLPRIPVLPTKCHLTCNANRVYCRHNQQLRLDRCGAQPARLVCPRGAGRRHACAAPRRAPHGGAAR